MVRSRIGSRPAIADTDALPGTDRWAGSSHSHEGACIEREAVDRHPDRPAGPFAFVLEIVAPWFGRTARSVGLGCLLALGCGGPEQVELEGVVRDGRTGDPVVGAQITTEDGRTLETDREGRFSVSAREGERVVARARGRCDAFAKVDPDRPLSLTSFERLDVHPRRRDIELDTEVRIEVRTPCDDGAPVRWQQVFGPALGPDQLRVEDGGRVLVLRAHALEQLEGRAASTYRLEGRGELGGQTVTRVVTVRAGATPTGACAATEHAWGLDGCGTDGGACGERCAQCHADVDPPEAAHLTPEVEEWRLSAMSTLPAELTNAHPTSREECASCHRGPGTFVAPVTCGSCHEPGAVAPHGLRVHDTVPAIAGAPADHLGSGAMCASCHRSDGSGPDAAPHAAQSEVLLGRGARLVPPMEDGAHRFIVDTCVRCHMARPALGDPLRGRVGGHTFAMRARGGEPAFNEAACTPCHGRVEPAAIGGERDRDGDGVAATVTREHAGALARVDGLLRERILGLGRRDRCSPARVATDVVEHDARLLLTDASGALLGDCDGSRSFEAGEAAVTARALPRRLADVAHDVVLLRSDGSSGLHNPAYTFRVLGAALRALQ
jgi:hypothetical protein